MYCNAMELSQYLKTLTPTEKVAFADRVQGMEPKASLGHLRNVASNFRECAPKLAIAVERASEGAVTRRELVKDWRFLWPEYAAAYDAEQAVREVAHA